MRDWVNKWINRFIEELHFIKTQPSPTKSYFSWKCIWSTIKSPKLERSRRKTTTSLCTPAKLEIQVPFNKTKTPSRWVEILWNLWWTHIYRTWTFTVCPGSSDPFYIVSYNIIWVTTSKTYSRAKKNNRWSVPENSNHRFFNII